jgi:hypothetical protein
MHIVIASVISLAVGFGLGRIKASKLGADVKAVEADVKAEAKKL